MLFALIITSCSRDDVLLQFLEQGITQASTTEDAPLDEFLVSNHVIIPGSTRAEGVPPASTGGIDLDVSESTRTAFLGEGFDITFTSNGNPIGAFVRFASPAGDFADEYFDVSLSYGQAGVARLFGKNRNSATTARIGENKVNVDFGRQIPPGEFCYEIRVYDSQQNISEPEQVCVTVESWGGKQGMSGKWIMVKEEKIIDGTTHVFELGSRGCIPYGIVCADGLNTVVGEDCYERTRAEVTINGDGTYVARFVGTDSWTDSYQSSQSCEPIVQEEDFDDTSQGNWAYVEGDERLTIVEYYYKKIVDGAILEEYTATVGQARLVMDGTLVFQGDSFVITDTRDDYGFEDGEIRKYYFERQ